MRLLSVVALLAALPLLTGMSVYKTNTAALAPLLRCDNIAPEKVTKMIRKYRGIKANGVYAPLPSSTSLGGMFITVFSIQRDAEGDYVWRYKIDGNPVALLS